MESQEKRDQLLSIRKHTSACANPTGFVGDLRSVLQTQWNKEKDGQVCASVIKDGIRHLLSFDGETFSTTDISQVPDMDLVNTSSQENTFDQVQAKLNIFKNRLSLGKIGNNKFQSFDPDHYKLNFVHQGEQVAVPAEPGTIIACILALMHPTYYDLSIYDSKNKGIINYSNKKSPQNIFEHSGDNVEQNTLLQFMTLKRGENVVENGQRMALFITGYKSTELEKFSSQAPANLLFDHQKKIIHIIEFPLDAATVGKNSLGIPGVGEIRDGFLYYDVFTKPETSKGSAPQTNDPLILAKLNAAVERFSSCKEIVAEDAVVPTPQKMPEILHEQSVVEMKEIVSPHILQVEVGNVEALKIETSHLIKSIGGVSCYLNGELDKRVHTEPPSDLGTIILPGLLGPIEGPFICLAAHPIAGSGISPHELEYFKHCFPIITVSTEVKDAARKTSGSKRINGLFIIDPAGSPVETIEQLASLNMNAVTALAGPLSLVLVKHGDSFRYFEGISMKGLLNEIPEFGDTVHLDMGNILNWCLENVMENPIVEISKCIPKIGEKSFELSEIILFLKPLSVDEILEMKQSILCLYYQLTKIYDDEVLQVFAKELFDVLDKKLMTPSKDTEELRRLQDDFRKGKTNLKISPRYVRNREEYEKKKRQLIFLMDKVSSLLSQKNVSSKSMSHKQLKRFNAIKENVDRLANMNRTEYGENIEMSCSKMGVIVCAGEPAELKDFINTVGKNEMKEKLLADTKKRMDKVFQQSLTNTSSQHLLQLSLHQQMIDALTATCLLELTAGTGPLHSQDNSVTLSIPESNEGSRGAILVPLLDMFVEMNNPYKGNWINLCNDPNVSMFRILLRSTFIKASIGRDLPQQIDTSSKDLGWGLVNIYLDIMHQLASYRTSTISEDNFNDTLCQQIRCLFGLILTQLAAGQDPISLIWQLWRENSRPELPMQSWHWPLYLEMAHLMQFTGWSQTVFRKNLRILLIRAMNSKIAAPMCRFLKAGNTKRMRIKNKYGAEYEKSLMNLFYPAKKNLTKITLALLESGEIPSTALLTEYETVFSQFTNKRVRKAGIKTILKELSLMIKFEGEYKEESKQYLHNHCMSTLRKYEPRIKICRLNLKRTLIKILSERKALDKDQIILLKNDMDEVSKTLEEKKNTIYSEVFNVMEKVFKLIVDLGDDKDNKEEIMVTDEDEKTSKELLEQMYKGLKFDCWNLDDVAHDENVDVEIKKSDEKKSEKKVDLIQSILEHNNENEDLQIMVNTKKSTLERVSILAKLSKIDDAGVLIKLAGFAGFGETDEKITENLFLALEEIFRCWAMDPPDLEKHVANKISSF